MSTPLPTSIRNLALGDLDHELAQTRRTLERVPDDQLEWRPHERSWTLGTLAMHVANLPSWGARILEPDEFDIATILGPRPTATGRDELLRSFDERVAELHAALEVAGDARLAQRWTLRQGEQVRFTLPRAAALRTILVSHMIHHRGQLTIYLRQVGSTIPALYGPSADEGM
jgi:uncharacterized damage-inducible protein DinB